MTTDHLTAVEPAGHESRLRLSGVGVGRTELLVLAGELDMASTGRADRAVDAALSRGPEQLVLDLQSLEFCDCSGLSSLLRAEEHARRAGVRLRVLAPSGQVGRLFRLTGCSELLSGAGEPPVCPEDPTRST